MASCFQVPPMVVPSSFTLRSASFEMNPKIGRRRNVINKRLIYRCCCSSSSSNNIPLTPLDPNDPSKQRLDAHVQDNNNPDMNSSSSSEDGEDGVKDLPFINVLMSSNSYAGRRAHGDYEVVRAAERYQRYHGGRRLYGPPGNRTTIPPPDLASMYLDERIIFLGMPLVEAVSELIFAQFVYLQYTDDLAPIYLYIDSPGTTREDGELVAHPSEGMAIYDTMMHVSNDVETVCFGDVAGYSCLLLAAGKLGRRFTTPHSRIRMIAPPVEGTGLKSASVVSRHAKEAETYRKLLFKLFAFHTGHRLGDIEEKLKHPIYMGPQEALDFGVVDKVLIPPDTTPDYFHLNLKPNQWHPTTRENENEKDTEGWW